MNEEHLDEFGHPVKPTGYQETEIRELRRLLTEARDALHRAIVTPMGGVSDQDAELMEKIDDTLEWMIKATLDVERRAP